VKINGTHYRNGNTSESAAILVVMPEISNDYLPTKLSVVSSSRGRGTANLSGMEDKGVTALFFAQLKIVLFYKYELSTHQQQTTRWYWRQMNRRTVASLKRLSELEAVDAQASDGYSRSSFHDDAWCYRTAAAQAVGFGSRQTVHACTEYNVGPT